MAVWLPTVSPGPRTVRSTRWCSVETDLAFWCPVHTATIPWKKQLTVLTMLRKMIYMQQSALIESLGLGLRRGALVQARRPCTRSVPGPRSPCLQHASITPPTPEGLCEHREGERSREPSVVLTQQMAVVRIPSPQCPLTFLGPHFLSLMLLSLSCLAQPQGKAGPTWYRQDAGCYTVMFT